MPTEDVTIIAIEGGEDDTSMETASPTPEVAEALAEQAETVAEQAEDTAETALSVAVEALDRTEETLSEVQELRKDQQDQWQDNVLTLLEALNLKLDQLTPSPIVETETTAADLEIVNPPAEETPMRPERKRKRSIGLKW